MDISIDNVEWYQINTNNPAIENPIAKAQFEDANTDVADKRNREEGLKFYVEEDKRLQDFYYSYDPFEVTDRAKQAYQRYSASLNAEERALLSEGKNFYEIRRQFCCFGKLVLHPFYRKQWHGHGLGMGWCYW